jgi:hypothetical protein
MTPQSSADATQVPADIVLRFAASPLPPLRPPRWTWAVATSAVLGLLVGFCLVVREIEQQGERRRQAVAVLADATWRCNALPARLARASCLTQLNAPRETPRVVQVVAGGGQR